MMSWLDRIISWASPRWGAERAAYRQIESLAAQGYRSSTSSRVGHTAAIGAGADYHLEQGRDRRKMVDRSQQLVRDNPVARGLLERNSENVVGCGITPQARTDDQEWNRLAEDLFNRWAEAPEVRGLHDLTDLQRVAQFALMSDGDVGIVKHASGFLELVESVNIAAPPGKEQTPRHVDGIDLDDAGAPVTYYVSPFKGDEHYTPLPRSQVKRTQVDAKNMIFLARRSRPSQTRGEPALAQCLEWFEQVDGLIEAVVTAARVSACVGLLIKRPAPIRGLNSATDAAGGVRKRFDLEPGMVKELMPGEEVSTLSPAQPKENFADFIALLGRILGLPMSMPLELLMLDFSRTNYSSARAALLQAYRSFRSQQQYLIRHLLRPIWAWKIREFIDEGLLPDRDDWDRHEWIAPGWAWVDPVKEIQAAHLSVDAGFSTVSEVLASQGKDFETYVKARRRELDTFGAAGVPPTRSTMSRDPMPWEESGDE